MSNNRHSAKNEAIRDIKQDLVIHGKCFLAFRTNLNPIMNKLVKKHLEEQKNLGKKQKQQHKYNVGDVLTTKPFCQGIDKVTITRMDNKYYYCKIVNGTAIIPIKVIENNYEPVHRRVY